MMLSDLIKYHDYILSKKDLKILKGNLSPKEIYLFENVRAGEEEINVSTHFYGTTTAGNSYVSLRNGLIQKIYNSYLGTRRGNPIQRNKIQLIRLVAICKILNTLQLNIIWVPIARKAIQKATRFDMLYESFDLYNMLSKHYGVIEKEINRSNEYHEQAVKALKAVELEFKVEWAFTRVRGIMRLKGVNTSQIQKIADEVETYENCGSHRFLFNLFAIRYSRKYVEDDLIGAIEVLNSAIKDFNELSFRHDSMIVWFLFQLLYCYQELGDIINAERTLIDIIDNGKFTSLQEYRCEELMFLIKMNKGSFEEAFDLLPILQKKGNKLGQKSDINRLLIYEVYLNLISGRKINYRRVRYNLNRDTGDKDEIYVPFMIAEVCDSYLNNKDNMIDQLEALEQRVYRNLKHKKYSRTKSFVKIISNILMHKPHRLELLNSNYSLSIHSLEIVKYELLLSRMIGE